MAATLLGGVLTRFNGTIGADFNGGLWTGQAPDGDSLPVVVMKLGPQKYNWTKENGYWTEGPLTFHVFGTGLAAVETLAAEITNTFSQNWTLIPIANGSVSEMLVNTYTVDADPDRDPNTEQVFHAELEFGCIVSLALT